MIIPWQAIPFLILLVVIVLLDMFGKRDWLTKPLSLKRIMCWLFGCRPFMYRAIVDRDDVVGYFYECRRCGRGLDFDDSLNKGEGGSEHGAGSCKS